MYYQQGPFYMALLPMTYPFIGFDHTNADDIMSLLERSLPGFFSLRIAYVRAENEYIKARCEDYYSKIHLTNVVSSWVFRVPQIRQQFPIKVLLMDKMPKYVTFQCLLNEPITDHGLFSKMIKENGVSTSRCYFDDGRDTREGFKVIFRADPVCAREIYKRRFYLSIRKQKVYFKVVDNPYAKLFRRSLPTIR